MPINSNTQGGYPLQSSVPPEVNLSLATKSIRDEETVPDFSPDGFATDFTRTIFSVPPTAPTNIPEIPPSISATVGNTTQKGKKRKAALTSQKDHAKPAKKQRINAATLQGVRMSSR